MADKLIISGILKLQVCSRGVITQLRKSLIIDSKTISPLTRNCAIGAFLHILRHATPNE
ncbi:hypothetical protein N9Y81_02495 [Akkermansiaceae bacterium]|nr:hypothetical protein [Akkermansiaceae bacterium]